MNNILIVEDEKRVADLLKAGLEEAGFNVMVAYDGSMGLRLFRSNSFDLIISDIVLPGLDGFGLCREVRAADKNIPILMLTALGTTDDKLDGFDSGADDYMVKPFDFRELLARIKVLMRRSVAEEKRSGPLTYADIVIDVDRHNVTRGGVDIRLTPKEFNLLVFMVRNAEKVITRIDIAKKVWNTHFDTGTNFIDVYINYLRKKIDRDFDTKLIHTKPGVGFILTSQP